MPKYNPRPNQATIDAMQAQNLRKKYSAEKLKEIDSLYHAAYDRMIALEEGEENAIRHVLGAHRISLPGKRWKYQMKLVRRIVAGEYGGLPKEKKPEQAPEPEQNQEGHRRGLGGLGQLMLVL